MASNANEDQEFIDYSPALQVRVYKDGTFERLNEVPNVPPSPQDPATGVSSKDVTISNNVSARLFLPQLSDTNQKLPVLVFFHGGGFCIESAFSPLYHRYLNVLTSRLNVLSVSVEYRLAPEHLLPAAYEDCWAALQWVAAHKSGSNQEPWIINHGDLDRLFVGGDSAGGNIAHNIIMRAGTEGLKDDAKILGGILFYPYFWSSNPVGSEPIETQGPEFLAHKIWILLYPSADGGIENPMVNPFAEGAPSLCLLGCSRLIVCVAEKDSVRERGVHYFEGVKKSGWKGEVELVEIHGEDHCFDVVSPDSDNAKDLMQRLAAFIAY